MLYKPRKERVPGGEITELCLSAEEPLKGPRDRAPGAPDNEAPEGEGRPEGQGMWYRCALCPRTNWKSRGFS